MAVSVSNERDTEQQITTVDELYRLAVWVARYAPPGTAYSREDIVQEIVIDLYPSLPISRRLATLIARRRSIDFLRRERGRTNPPVPRKSALPRVDILTDDHARRLTAGEPFEEQVVDEIDLQWLVERVLARLSPHARLVYQLHVQGGKSQAELARMLDVSPSRIAQYVSHIRTAWETETGRLHKNRYHQRGE